MKTSITNYLGLLIFVLISPYVFSSELNPNTKKSAYDHLYEINKEWRDHAKNAPSKAVNFISDIDRISYHINLVEQTLRNNIPNGISGKALENRLSLLTELDKYGDQKVFPTNLYHTERTPYFIDDYGVHCAVGYLIMKSGHSELSNKIRDEHNYDYVRDIKTEGVVEWAKEFGFELSELAWIQPAYSSWTMYSPVAGGTDSTVTVLCKDETYHRLIFAGEFNNIDGGTPCDGIGYYQYGAMHCLGGGLEGKINHVYESNGDIFVSGRLSDGGTFYSEAIFSNGYWTYSNIPGLGGKEARTGMAGTSDYKRELVIMNDQGMGEHEVWRLSNTDVWEKQATALGQINSMAVGDTHHAYGGQFTSLTLHLSGGDQTLNSINACRRENSNENWTALTGQIGDTVNVVKWLNGTFFFGCTINQQPTNPDAPYAPIAMLESDTLAGLYGGMMGEMGGFNLIINDIDAVSDQRLVVGGKFQSGSAGEFGESIAIVDYTNFPIWSGGPSPQTVWTTAIGSLVSPLNTLTIFENTLFIGGSFDIAPTDTIMLPLGFGTPQSVYTDVYNIAQMNNALSIGESELVPFKIYPNPSSDIIKVEAETPIQSIRILDMNGRPVLNQKNGQSSVDVHTLNSGTYLIKVTFESGQISHQRFIKQ